MINYKNICKLIMGLSVLTTSALYANTPEDFALTQSVEQEIKNKYPSTKIMSVKPSVIAGVYEVRRGRNIAYTDKEGRYFLFGRLYDMHEQVDLTADSMQEVGDKLVWPKDKLDDAIKTVKGNGESVFAIFTDPSCGYCKKMEMEFADIDNVTIYRFLVPLLGSRSEAINIWCSEDQEKAFTEKMLNGISPRMGSCTNPIQSNLALAQDMGVMGTPLMIKPNGDVKYGYVNKEELMEWLK